MPTIRAILVDDEPIWRNQLAKVCAACQVEILASCNGIASARAALRDATPDVLLLDVELGSGQTGFDLLNQLEQAPPVIFVTSHRDFAIEAFRIHALHYLIKPIAKEHLLAALARLPPLQAPEQRIVQLREGVVTCVVPVVDILCIQSSGDYSEVSLRDGRRFTINKPLRQWRSELPNALFISLDRFHIVNRSAIIGMRVLANAKSILQLETGLRIPIGTVASRRAKSALSTLQ